MDWMNWKTWTAAALILIAVFAIYTFAAPDTPGDKTTPVAAATSPLAKTSSTTAASVRLAARPLGWVMGSTRQ